MGAETSGEPAMSDRIPHSDRTSTEEAAGGPQTCCNSRKNSALGEKPCNSREMARKATGIKRTCCSSPQADRPRLQPLGTGWSPKSSIDDVEKGKPAPEHVVLSVEGLTCVGCENKLYRSLSSFSSIDNLQTSLVLSRAEFDLDLSAHSVSDVIRSVEKTTGFACERITNRGQHLDVIVAGDGADFIGQKFPSGVTDMTLLEKGIVRVSYNPRTVGSRDLIEKKFETPISLAPPRPHPGLAAGRNHVRTQAYMTLISAFLTMPVLILAWAPLPQHDLAYGAVSLVLATTVQCVIAGPFYPSALRGLFLTHVIEMDLLIVLSTTTAYVFSVISFAYRISGRPLSVGEFFETGTLLVTLIMLGRLVSAIARHKAIESISIRSLQTNTALLVKSGGSEQREIDARLLQYGDVFKVMPESHVPTDGVILSGISEIDESMVTGEAQLVEKRPGSTVIAGSLNGPGTIIVRLTQLPGENTISEIAGMVDEAKFSKPRVQALADRVAGYFVPVVVFLTLITFAVWVAVGKVVRKESAASAVIQAITYAISVLIVSCPCAIGLAVPIVVVIAGGVAAKRGVVFKSSETIEVARKVRHVVFDKTGTLTQGQLSVCTEEYLSQSQESVASLALGLTSNIKHPVSAAIAAYLKSLGVEPAPVENVKSVPGSGVEGTYRGTPVRAGNSRWLAIESSPQVQSTLSKGLTVFCISSGSTLLAIYGLSDTLRPDAHAVISSLKRRNITISIVSGDDHGAVQSIATQLAIPSTHVRSRCTPLDKQTYIKSLTDHNSASRKGNVTVLFCGDGTNDAPALATATIGVHMPSTTDTAIAQSAADAVLIRPYLSGILVLLDLSAAAYRRIQFNFAWAFVYNIFAILLAAGAFVNARIPPRFAGLGEIVSVVPVVLVAVQLRWSRAG
ncbi:MAG: hypothetical protein M1830_003435 [Pleopsidium flavum]|nr:MAG: hypothetical protein M1830_003435 [Pleopsidium flavum]